jgi:chromosome segregation ATPase
MFKKLFMGAGLAVLGLAVLNWAGLSSYSGTVVNKVREGFKKQVPLEFEIERLRYQVSELIPDMKKHCSTIAEEMVAVETLRNDITETRANLDRQKTTILAMKKDVEAGAKTINYNGRDYSASRVRNKLSRDFESYQRCAAELKIKEQTLEARERSLDTAREQLATMRTQKEELEVQLAQLEADLKTLRLAQSRTKFHLDDSGLARCKATLADIRNRLKVEKTATELTGEFANDNIPVVESKPQTAADLAKEINSYFQNADVADRN